MSHDPLPPPPRPSRTTPFPVPLTETPRLELWGWGLVVPRHLGPETWRALLPLRRLRHRQASTEDPRLYHELTYEAGDDAAAFLARHGSAKLALEPRSMPFYLLLVGTVEDVPAEVEHELCRRHAVGRLPIRDPDLLATYAERVAGHERARRWPEHPPRIPILVAPSPEPAAADLADAEMARGLEESLATLPGSFFPGGDRPPAGDREASDWRIHLGRSEEGGMPEARATDRELPLAALFLGPAPDGDELSRLARRLQLGCSWGAARAYLLHDRRSRPPRALLSPRAPSSRLASVTVGSSPPRP